MKKKKKRKKKTFIYPTVATIWHVSHKQKWRLLIVATHLFGEVHVGQAVQGEDVSILPVLVDLDERLLCCTQCHWIFTRALHPDVPLHWCGTDVHTAQRQQQSQQRTVLHGQTADRDAAWGRLHCFIFADLFTLAPLSRRVNITVALQTPPAAKAHVSRTAAPVVPPSGQSAAIDSYTIDLIRAERVAAAMADSLDGDFSSVKNDVNLSCRYWGCLWLRSDWLVTVTTRYLKRVERWTSSPRVCSATCSVKFRTWRGKKNHAFTSKSMFMKVMNL